MTMRDILKANVDFEMRINVDLCDANRDRICTLFDDFSDKIGDQNFLDYELVGLWADCSTLIFRVVNRNQKKVDPLEPFFTNTVTMEKFDYGYAWENRFNIPVNSGDLLLVDGKRKFQIVDSVMPVECLRNSRCPWYKLKPVEDTLEDMKREYDKVARKNYGMTVGKYPDFTIDVESNWFFARDVRW